MNKTAYIFPGQGSQYAGMGLDLYEQSSAAKAVFDEADRTLGFSLSKLCFEGPDEELKKTVNAQPALLTMSIACLAAAKERLPAADYMAGHSLGEYSALTAANSMTFADALRLSRERGRLMYEAGLQQPGTMSAIIGMQADALLEVCELTGAYVANYNCPGQIVISGKPDKIRAAGKMARQKGAKLAIPLAVSGAFHSPLMKPAAEQLAPQIRASAISAPSVPVIGNVFGRELQTEEDVRTELADQICNCVQWEATIRYLLAQGVTTFVEIGPGEVLTGLLKRIAPDARHMNVGKMEDIEALR